MIVGEIFVGEVGRVSMIRLDDALQINNERGLFGTTNL